MRFIFTLFLYASIGHWLYSEAAIIAPVTTPIIDQLLTFTRIPTHDEWDKQKISEYASKILPEQTWLKTFGQERATTHLKKLPISSNNYGHSSNSALGFKEL